MSNLPEDFWDEEDARNAELDRIVREKKLGGYSDQWADLNVLDDDPESDGKVGNEGTLPDLPSGHSKGSCDE